VTFLYLIPALIVAGLIIGAKDSLKSYRIRWYDIANIEKLSQGIWAASREYSKLATTAESATQSMIAFGQALNKINDVNQTAN
jgi:hypothetical protein